MDKFTQISLPEFIHCENEPKNGDFIHDNRQFIYAPKFLSLVELIPFDDIQIAYPMELFQKQYFYTSELYRQEEEWLLVLVQNNLEAYNSLMEIENIDNGLEPITPDRFLDMAWDYYKKYLVWEDSQNL